RGPPGCRVETDPRDTGYGSGLLGRPVVGFGRGRGFGLGRRRKRRPADDLDLRAAAFLALFAPGSPPLHADAAAATAPLFRLAGPDFLLAPLVAGGAVARRTREHRVGELRGEQADGADGVVVGGDDEVDRIGVAVGIHQADDRDAEAVGLVHRQMLLLRVDDEEHRRQARHLLDAAQVALELLHLAGEPGDLLLRQPVEEAVVPHLFQALEALDTLLDRLEVGQGAAEPAVRHEELVAATR